MASELTPVPDDLDFGVTIQGLVVSQQIFGRYTLKHVLGRGGMGVVWLAHDERLERDVALKFLPDAVNFDPVALDDLKRETRRCLDLTHPNIIRIYDFVKDPQAAAISMEYIDGKTLAAVRIAKNNRIFEVDELRDWMGQACQALYYAHEEVKVVHRDLKPANLMLTSRGQLKIADFGVARSVSDSMSQVTMRKGTSGTLVYMSPQQMNGDMSRVTDDVYAIGATIYEFLTSKPPFYSGDIPFQVRSSIPRSMTERRAEMEITGEPIPQEWEETIAACLAKVPEQRPSNMQELAERLGLPVGTARTRSTNSTSPAPATTTAKKAAAAAPPKIPRKPFPTQFVLGSAGGLVALGLIGWLLWSFVLWPLFATPGQVMVTSDPIGATVHIPGKSDEVTPAVFEKVHIGNHKVTVSADGYDPVEQTVKITEGAQINLGTVILKRAYGKLTISSLPPHARYTLSGTGTASAVGREGGTPDFLPEIPAGTYQMTVEAPGLAPYSTTLTVDPHATQTEKADLVLMAVSSDASPDPGKVLRGELSAGQLDDKGKAELVTLRKSAFEKYLGYGLTAPAADQIGQLKTMGQDTTAQEKELAAKRASVEANLVSQIGDLIDDKKFATAQARLKNLDGVLEKESIDRLNARFAAPLAQYQQQVDSAVKISQSGAPSDAYDQLKSFAAQYPDDLNLQLAIAQIQTRMPPDHDRLTAQLKIFRQIAAQDKDWVADADFQAMQEKFANELKQLDDLASAVSEAKDGSSGGNSTIARLEEQKAALERRRVGENEADSVVQTVNLFGRVVTGHSVVNTGSYFPSEEAKDEAVSNIQARIDAEQQSEAAAHPRESVQEAQQRYDAFVAQVPW
jgi:Protein kinase domain/PEGA domain